MEVQSAEEAAKQQREMEMRKYLLNINSEREEFHRLNPSKTEQQMVREYETIHGEEMKTALLQREKDLLLRTDGLYKMVDRYIDRDMIPRNILPDSDDDYISTTFVTIGDIRKVESELLIGSGWKGTQIELKVRCRNGTQTGHTVPFRKVQEYQFYRHHQPTAFLKMDNKGNVRDNGHDGIFDPVFHQICEYIIIKVNDWIRLVIKIHINKDLEAVPVKSGHGRIKCIGTMIGLEANENMDRLQPVIVYRILPQYPDMYNLTRIYCQMKQQHSIETIKLRCGKFEVPLSCKLRVHRFDDNLFL